MTEISKQQLAHLAKLSNLTIEDQEAEGLRQDLSKILGYVQQLSAVDTEGVEPTYQIGDLQNVWREDELVEESVKPEQLLDLPAKTQDQQIKVPKVL